MPDWQLFETVSVRASVSPLPTEPPTLMPAARDHPTLTPPKDLTLLSVSESPLPKPMLMFCSFTLSELLMVNTGKPPPCEGGIGVIPGSQVS